MALVVPRQTASSLKTKEAKDEDPSKRSALGARMMRFALFHFSGSDASALQDYTFERYKTKYPNAKTDLDIFDGAGKLVFQGSEFHSGLAGYWRPSRVAMVAEMASDEKEWGHRRAGRVSAGVS